MKAGTQWQTVRPVRVPSRSENFRSALRKTLRKPQFWFGVVALVPLLLWYATFAFWPVLQAFRLAVLNYHLLDPASSRFVGLGNFQAILADPLFPLALGNSALWGLLGMGFGVPIALLISVCLANVRRGRQQYQTLIFVPVVLSLVAVLLLVRFLFDPENGP